MPGNPVEALLARMHQTGAQSQPRPGAFAGSPADIQVQRDRSPRPRAGRTNLAAQPCHVPAGRRLATTMPISGFRKGTRNGVEVVRDRPAGHLAACWNTDFLSAAQLLQQKIGIDLTPEEISHAALMSDIENGNFQLALDNPTATPGLPLKASSKPGVAGGLVSLHASLSGPRGAPAVSRKGHPATSRCDSRRGGRRGWSEPQGAGQQLRPSIRPFPAPATFMPSRSWAA
jgi:hypothetical protein